MADFIHLHVHSDFSLADAAVSVKNLVKRARELGMTHLALTDHGNMFGAMEFLAACEETVAEEYIDNDGKAQKRDKKRFNPQPIIGCEVYVAPGSRHEKKKIENERRYYHLVLLATNREGYFNLVKLCSFAYTEGFYERPRIDEELLDKYHGGLIALSACVAGVIPRLIRAGKIAEAEQKALHYRDLFGVDEQGRPNFYLEIQNHGIPAETLKCPYSQQDINNEIIAISRKTGIPLVATNDVHYLNQDDYIAHDVLLCIGTNKLYSEKARKNYHGDQFYFKTADEMAALFPDCPEAITNTTSIAGRCNTDIPNITTEDLPRYLPEYDLPSGFSNADDYLRHLANEGLAKRYPHAHSEHGAKWRAIQERLDYELGIIISMGFTGYFLIVEDFVRWAGDHDIPVGPGRGSGAGSIVAYTLYITNIDPLKYNLLFERFLNPERISMPDFDIDFPHNGREAVINYITQKYGREQVGQIITFQTLGAKGVIKDVARVLNISYPDSEMITKLISDDPKITLQKAFKEEPRLKELENDSRYTEMFSLARKLEGLNRNSSIHASGVVIGNDILYNLVPLFKDSKGAIATQFGMKHLEKCGLVKMDILGIKALDVIKHTEELIRQKGGEHACFDIETIPENDKATFKMLGEGQSFAVFQFASDGMKNNLKRAKPGKIEDLIALNALYRPGPMANIPLFIDSKNGRRAITYPHINLETILKETYGVIVYQEQVMQVARSIAGYSMGQADMLRKAMGKKTQEIIEEERTPFIEGAVKQGYSRNVAGKIYDEMAPFGGYGFNKSHSACYAVLAYRTAWLKANFPLEFMAANLTNESYNNDKVKLTECIEETHKMGIVIDPPDINRSETIFSIKDDRIVYGFLGIKGIGEASSDEIVRCRKDISGKGESPYVDFMDFLNKIDFKLAGKAVIKNLIQTGSFDKLGESRGNLLGNLDRAFEFVQKQKEDKKSGASLFGDTDEKEFADFVFDDFPQIGQSEKLKDEKELIGFFLSGHPLDEQRELWQKEVKVNLGNKESLETGDCTLIGIIKNIKEVNSKSGKMAYAVIEDYNGEIDAIFFSKAWETYRGSIEDDKIVNLKGRIEYRSDKDKYNFIVEAKSDTKQDEGFLEKWEQFYPVWQHMADLKTGSIAQKEKGNYTVIGELKSLRETQDRNGNGMAFGTLQDFEGEIDLVFFSKPWSACRNFVFLNDFIALKGTWDPANDRNKKKPGLLITSIADLAALSRSASRKTQAREESAGTEQKPLQPVIAEPINAIHICLTEDAAECDDNILPLRNYLAMNPGPCPVFIHIPDENEQIIRSESGLSLEAEKEAVGVLEGCRGVLKAWKEQCS
ncbi:MAG: DNA polymerase III subunit alpha [Treponema sp.]|nr:DNA polymerase III subunit alpha [Treponema sp.]